LASLISGLDNSYIFAKFIHNDKYSDYNFDERFQSLTESVGLDRVVVLTTSSTCSASELLINSLKPYIEVITIDSTTCGKPVGMYPQDFCDKVISAINFEVRNANNEGGYFDGISPRCKAIDNLTVDLGNEAEDMLNEALYYLQNGDCSPTEPMITNIKVKELKLTGFTREIGAF
jgi:NADPH:quinone reductase-like Zn-dependent oxidoreductase